MARPRLLVTAETPERKTLSTDHLKSEAEIGKASICKNRRQSKCKRVCKCK